MSFTYSIPDLINMLFIAGGIGICTLCLMQISASAHIRKIVRRYFQTFFGLLLFYISAHLAREILNALPGAGVRSALYVITSAEIIAAAFMSHIMSLLVLAVARMDNKKKAIGLVVYLYALLIGHIVVVLAGLPFDLIFYFDEANVYHRGAGYLLSNLAPVAMLIFDLVVLLRNREKIDKRIRIAFIVYMIAPAVAIGLQALSARIQFIIFATVACSVYMFSVIIAIQNEQFVKQKLESSRLDAELNMASRIQEGMLPSIFPPFPDRDEFDLYASMDPAKEVGGDFYDFFLVDDDHLCMVMADVSGKGVPAALFMMASKIILANNAMMGKSPAQILTDTNAAICSGNKEEMFVTVWLGILEISTGKLTAANAGHEYPAVQRPDGAFELLKDKHGFVIGGMDGIRYKEYEVQLAPGSKLFLYTDGVPEATNAQGELFGADRMVAALNRDGTGEPKDILTKVRESVDAFVKDAEQFDDLTMLCMTYKGRSEAKEIKEVQ